MFSASAPAETRPYPQSARIDLADAKSAALRDGLAYWNAIRGTRRYPARSDIQPRAIKKYLSDLVLIRVLEGGKDYEYRIVGDRHEVAYGFHLKSKRLSEMQHFLPDHFLVLHKLYARVLRTGEPFAIRGWAMRGEKNPQRFYSEMAFLPLGPDDATIDHILNFGTYTPDE